MKKSDAQHKKDGTWRADRHDDPDAKWEGDPDQFRADLRSSDRPRKIVEQYCKDVLDGTFPAGRLVKLAVKRYLWDRKEAHKRGIVFDEGKATEACEFFPQCLRHSKGKWANKPFTLTPPQMFIVWNVFGWTHEKTGLRRFTRAHNEVARKFGKALALDTPIPTPAGWTTMGAVQVGDVVFDENGQPCKVTGATGVMENHRCYRVAFSDGTSIVADAGHRWLTTARSNQPGKQSPKGYRHGETVRRRVRTTEEIADTLRAGTRGDLNHRIENAKPLQCGEHELPIDPYVLGVWLGDGDSGCARITFAEYDTEIIDAIKERGEEVHITGQKAGRVVGATIGGYRRIGKTRELCERGHKRRKGKYAPWCPTCDKLQRRGQLPPRPKTLHERLRLMDLLHNKHIPPAYLRASIEARWELLQGLMDSDGHVSTRGHCEFTSTNERLAIAALELCRTLGIKATLATGRATLRGVDCGPKYRVTFTTHTPNRIAKLTRKQERLRELPSVGDVRSQSRTITACDPVKTVPVRCIAVDSASHLFLAGEGMVPTHNSETASGITLKQGTMDDPPDAGAEIYLCATKEEQARTQTFRQCTRMVAKSPFLKKRCKVQAKQIVVHPHDPFQPDSVIRPIGNDSDSSDGFDQSGAILDELHAYQKRHKEFYERMTTAGGAREQELIWIWTTAGSDKSETWIELREIAVRTLESVETGEPINDHIFAFIACIDEDDDPLSMDIESDEFIEVMRKANPNMPDTPKPDYIRQQARDALNSPIGRNKFLRFHANIRVSSSVQPFPAELLKQYAERVYRMPPLSVGGFDVGRSDDFAAWSIAWREGNVIRLYGKAYTSKDRPEHLQTAQIADWVRDGCLVEHPGNQVDFASIADDIEKAHQEFNVQKWAMDESFAKLLGQELQRRLGEDTVTKFVQTYSTYNAPCRELQKEFNAGRVSPDDNPAFRWQLRNITFKADTKDQWMPDKGIGREYKIDAGIAAIMAYGLLLFDVAEPEGPSVSVLDISEEELEKLADYWEME